MKRTLVFIVTVFTIAILLWGGWHLIRPSGYGNERVAERTTAWKLIGPNHRIVTDALPVDHIDGISCWIGRPKTGGVKGAVGLAEDLSNVDIDCDQTGPVIARQGFKSGQKIFVESRSAIFKSLDVTVTYDAPRRAFVFLATSGRIIEGSPQFGQSVVTVKPWRTVEPDLRALAQ